MIFDQSGSNESQFMQALVPMVDLFAVLAIVFMVYSNEQITETKLQSDARIKEIVAEIQETKKRLEAVD